MHQAPKPIDAALARWEKGEQAVPLRPLRTMPKKPEPATGYLTVGEIADELCVSKMTVYRAIHDGRLRAHAFRRSFRVRRADLDAFLDDTVVEW